MDGSKPDARGAEAWREAYAAPDLGLPTDLSRATVRARFRQGDVDVDACERTLATAARRRAALDLAIADGLLALRKGDRLASLGYHLDDYAREVLDISETTTRKLVRLAVALRERPLLREALGSGRVGLRAAETVLPIAVGDAEASWVDRASLQTVRELEDGVRRARAGEEADEEWLRVRTHLPDDERLLLDAGLELAGRQVGPNRIEQFEALAQEYVGEFADEDDGDDARAIRDAPMQRLSGRNTGDGPRRARLEEETGRWSALPRAVTCAVPEVDFGDGATAKEVDERLRALAGMRRSWDVIVGWCAHAIRSSGILSLLGFSSFRHYVEERLQLPPRAIEQRERLERRIWDSPALLDARRQKLSYEKLRVLARLPERDIASWVPRAHALTCIELRRQIEGERERQMRAKRRLSISIPLRVAGLVASAIRIARRRLGGLERAGKCFAVMACHFLLTWCDSVDPPRTRSQKARERDGGFCQVPGCSHPADHSHHVEFRSHGGGDELSNQTGACEFHHLRCIHGGFLRVTGKAPDGLTWWLRGKRWNGGVCEA
ncbi:MAG TPA: HNH endonuclease signature motif containing protein [Anaeromyxobacteraceae bacterium]|nr:HNH endonuclease signature motif containing protein [Anaeromyxobacteraceae bacterium]